MAGFITKQSLDFIANNVISLMRAINPKWIEQLKTNDLDACASLFLRFGISENMWKKFVSAGDEKEPDMKPFVEFKDKLERCESNEDYIKAINEISGFASVLCFRYGTSILSDSMMAGFICTNKCLGKRLDETEQELLKYVISNIENCHIYPENVKIDILLYSMMTKMGICEITYMLFVAFYTVDYENFREIVELNLKK